MGAKLHSLKQQWPRPHARIRTMSRRCELTGKAVLSGHLVSHSNRKTKRKFLPNLVNVTLQSDALQRSVRLRVSANALRTVEHRGGLDAVLSKAQGREVSLHVRVLKRDLEKERAEGWVFRAGGFAARRSTPAPRRGEGSERAWAPAPRPPRTARRASRS